MKHFKFKTNTIMLSRRRLQLLGNGSILLSTHKGDHHIMIYNLGQSSSSHFVELCSTVSHGALESKNKYKAKLTEGNDNFLININLG